MFCQIEALTDTEWQSTTIDSVGCSPELLGIIRDINSLSQSFDREKGKIIYDYLLNVRQELPLRESELCAKKCQMAIYTAMAIKHGTVLYFLC